MSDQVFTRRPVTRDDLREILEDPAQDNRKIERLATELQLRFHQIDRLQFALHKCDKWSDVLGDLFEEKYLETYDMEEIL